MTDSDWLALILEQATHQPTSIRMFTYRGKQWQSWSKPVVLAAEDGTEFVVKSPHIGPERARAAVTEQVVSFLGKAIGAPVAEVALVQIDQELIDMNKQTIAHLGTGICHGSRRIPNASDRDWLQHVDLDANRSRFAAIAVLYGWTHPCDQQLIYDLSDPYHVHSVDHGWFFPGGYSWSVASLSAFQSATTAYAPILRDCRITNDELRAAIEPLREITHERIARAVSQPPDEWGITQAERVALARFLANGQEKLCSLSI